MWVWDEVFIALTFEILLKIEGWLKAIHISTIKNENLYYINW